MSSVQITNEIQKGRRNQLKEKPIATMMFPSSLTTALCGLLACCVCVHTAATGRTFQTLNTPSFVGLNASVVTALEALLVADLKATNATINSLSPVVSACLGSIETKQAECIQCINSSCQARVDALGCTDVTPVSSSGDCSLAKALCDMKQVVDNAGVAINLAAGAVKQIAEKVAGAIQKAAEEAIKTIGGGLKTAGQEIKNVAEQAANGIKNTAGNVISEIDNAAQVVGGAIAKGVEDAVNAVGNAAKDGINEIKNFFGSIGRRRRQAQAEPVCNDFSQDTNACLYYAGQCQSCSAFNLAGSVEPTISELVNGVCGSSDLTDYQTLEKAILHVVEIIEAYQNFTLQAIRLDHTVWENTGYKYVQFDYGMVVQNYTEPTSSPVNPYDSVNAGPLIAQDAYNAIFPTVA